MPRLLFSLALTAFAPIAIAHEVQSHRAIEQDGAVLSGAGTGDVAAFDTLAAHVHRVENTVSFHMTKNGVAGAENAKPLGEVGGAPVRSYVWPTSLDPSVVRFDESAGILAMAATRHLDFDDTPLFDQNLDGNPRIDGGVWNSHWVVLASLEACRPGALGVADIPDGATPKLSAIPILLDGTGFTPVLEGPEVTMHAVVTGGAASTSFDGVTEAPIVNESVHASVLCVADVFDIASGGLSLPGSVE